jgi:hypothetical protein
MSVRTSLAALVTEPSPEGLWQLRGDLLAAGVDANAALLRTIGAFSEYLDRVRTGVASRDFSHLASKLDISAISGVILERLAEAGESSELAMGILSGALSEGLMVLATRQHVRAWEGELGAVHRAAGWILYDELWRWSAALTPELPPERRRAHLDALMDPINDPRTSGLVKAAAICRLFQIVIASGVVRVTADPDD